METSIKETFTRTWINVIMAPVYYHPTELYNILIKNDKALADNSKYVSVEESKENYIISYDRFKSFNESNENYFFFIDNIEMIQFYALDSMKKRRGVNYYILFLSVKDFYQEGNRNSIRKFFKLLNPASDLLFFTMSSIDLKIKLNAIEEFKTTIAGKQLAQYKQLYLKYLDSLRNEIENEFSRNYSREAQNSLNVYLDSVVKSLTNLSLDQSLQRAPKFRKLISFLLLKNKARHLIRMDNNKYGINSFLTVYNKIDHDIEITLIKKEDRYDDKVKKLTNFNMDNAPGILLTDYNFSGLNVPKNLNYYHIIDGGRRDDLITYFECIKTRNYSGSYPRVFNIVSHYAITPNEVESTIDSNDFENFKNRYNNAIGMYDNYDKKAYNIIQKNGKFYSVMNEK